MKLEVQVYRAPLGAAKKTTIINNIIGTISEGNNE